MANLKPYDPFGDADDFFRGFALRPMRVFGDRQAPTIKMDVKEDEQAYQVHAELPGVKKEDLEISVDGNMVTISGEVRSQKERKEGERVVHSERTYGAVSRSFVLDQNVDEAAASAKFTDGILELRLPKRTGPARRQIRIE